MYIGLWASERISAGRGAKKWANFKWFIHEFVYNMQVFG